MAMLDGPGNVERRPGASHLMTEWVCDCPCMRNGVLDCTTVKIDSEFDVLIRESLTIALGTHILH